MTNSLTTYRRRGGTFLIAGALLTIAGAVLSAIVQGSSSVPDDLVRYPFSHDAFLPFTVFAAACHLLMLAGIVYLARGGLAGDSRTGRIGLGCVIAGLALLFVCEWPQLPFANQHTSSVGPSILDGGFGLATLLLAGGMIAVGVATLRTPSLGSWRQYAPLICGLLSLIVIPIQFTSALWVGITVFCLGYVLLGVAAISEGVQRTDHAIQIA
jgi:predicted membrane channel-forming protein YqfA (hemolysin III family)